MDLSPVLRGLASGAALHVVNYHNTPPARAAAYDRQLAMLAERFALQARLQGNQLNMGIELL